MIRWFAWLTAVNVAGVIVLAFAVLVPGVLAYVFFLPRASVEVRLVPVDPSPAEAPPPAAAAAPARLEIPAEFRSPDLVARPWDELPGGAVRLRN